MIIANFTDSNYDLSRLKDVIEKLLIGYNKEINNINIRNILLFALRKLYFIEAYFLYTNLVLNTENFEFIQELRKRQIKLKLLLYNINVL